MTKKSETKTHTGRAAVELRRRILNGDIAGGERLLEVELANDLQISRTPIRAALSVLAEEGLLIRARGGFIARSFAYQDILDMIELRGVLEGTAARLAAEREVAPKKMRKINAILLQLDDCLAASPQTSVFERYSDLNSQYHLALATLAGSSTIAAELDRVNRLPFASPSAFLLPKNQQSVFNRSMHAAQEQHRAIVRAIEARQGSRAEALAREHAMSAQEKAHRLYDSGGKVDDAFSALALMDAQH